MAACSAEQKRIYEKTLSSISLQNIAKNYIGETLSDSMVQEVGRDVRDALSKIVAEAMKYARRTRSFKMGLEHLLFAMEQHDVSMDLIHIEYDRTMDDEDEETTVYTRQNQVKPTKIKDPSNTSLTKKWRNSIKICKIKNRKCAPRQWMRCERVLIMANRTFPLTKEQQEFFASITISCMGTSENKRREALRRLSTDASLQPMVPSLIIFIAGSVYVHLRGRNFTMLLYLMRMVNSLLSNTNVRLHFSLHLLIPATVSCSVAHQLCCFPAVQDHWALRKYACNTLAKILQTVDSIDNRALTRTINVYNCGLQGTSLPSIFGSLCGMANMGNYAVRNQIIPQIRAISTLIEPHLTKTNTDANLDKQASIHIWYRIIRICAPILKNIHEPSEAPEKYTEKYGFMGCSLHAAVAIERAMDCVAKEPYIQLCFKLSRNKNVSISI